MSKEVTPENSGDIIHDTLQCVRCLVNEGAELNDETLLEVEKGVRRYYGGQTIYCQQRIAPDTLNRLVKADHERGVSRKVIASAYGITTKTVGTILRKFSA